MSDLPSEMIRAMRNRTLGFCDRVTELYFRGKSFNQALIRVMMERRLKCQQ